MQILYTCINKKREARTVQSDPSMKWNRIELGPQDTSGGNWVPTFWPVQVVPIFVNK